MTEQIIQRSSLLIEHRRFAEAEAELAHALQSEPKNPIALSLLSLCKTESGNHDEALRLIQQALGQQPDNPRFLYLTGLIWSRKGNPRESLKFIKSALSFDPHNADYFGAVAMLMLQEKNWEEALAHANRGLQSDSENLVCLNARSTALLKLDRKEESFETIKEALHNDPHNDDTHANLGWGLLERGDHKKALESFREALKLNPENEYAKAGMVEALKARYLFYRLFLRYVFWLSNQSSRFQWILMIGLYIGIRILSSVRTSNPDLAPFITPVIYLYSAFAISTWVLDPLANLFLRMNVYGRYALSKAQTFASTFTGIGLLITIIGVIGLISTDLPFDGTIIFGIGFMILYAGAFKAEKKKRTIAMSIAIGLTACGVLFQLLDFTGTPGGPLLFMIFLWGTVLYQWIVNALISR